MTIETVKWLMGGLAAVAAFLLVQSDVVVGDAVKVALGAFLVFAAYVNPASISQSIKSAVRGKT